MYLIRMGTISYTYVVWKEIEMHPITSRWQAIKVHLKENVIRFYSLESAFILETVSIFIIDLNQSAFEIYIQISFLYIITYTLIQHKKKNKE